MRAFFLLLHLPAAIIILIMGDFVSAFIVSLRQSLVSPQFVSSCYLANEPKEMNNKYINKELNK